MTLKEFDKNIKIRANEITITDKSEKNEYKQNETEELYTMEKYEKYKNYKIICIDVKNEKINIKVTKIK